MTLIERLKATTPLSGRDPRGCYLHGASAFRLVMGMRLGGQVESWR